MSRFHWLLSHNFFMKVYKYCILIEISIRVKKRKERKGVRIMVSTAKGVRVIRICASSKIQSVLLLSERNHFTSLRYAPQNWSEHVKKPIQYKIRYKLSESGVNPQRMVVYIFSFNIRFDANRPQICKKVVVFWGKLLF